MKHTSSSFGVTVHVELGGGFYIAGSANRSADHDQMADHVRQVGLLLEGRSDVRERTGRDNRYVAGRRADFVADHFYRRVLVMPLRDGEVRAAHTISAEQMSAIGTQHLIVRSSAEPRPTG